MNLSNESRQALMLHFANTALAYDAQVGQQYAATPSKAQTIYNKIVEDGNAFLRQINMVPVTEVAGDKIGLFLTKRVGSRTQITPTVERTPKNLSDTDSKGYQTAFTEFDVAIGYALIDAWAKFPDFADRYMTLVRQAIGNDMLQTGWTGTSVAATTNMTSNPLLQDLNKGWLQAIREFNSGSQRVIGTGPSPISLGPTTGIFKTLDGLIHDAKQRLPIWHRTRPDLVALIANDVLSQQEETYFETNGNKPTEKAVMSGLITRAYAGLPSISPPFMPNGTVLVTSLQNLSIYYQDSSVRRLQKDKPEKNEVQDFNSVNLGYVVEDEQMTSLVENITFVA
jgi:P2 family phage major capsid protein